MKKLQIITVETEKIRDNPLCKSLRKYNMENLCTWIGQDFNEFGLMRKWTLGTKISLIQDYINENKIVLFLDYRDTLLLDDSESILNTFLSFDKPIIFGRDMLCYPDESLSKYYPTPDYLNSGVFIGYGKYIKWMINESLTKYKSEDDQLMYSKVFLENQDKIGIDIKCELIYNCQRWKEKTEMETIFDVQYDYKNQKIIHRKYNTVPKIYHSPGSIWLIYQAKKLLNEPIIKENKFF